MGKLDVFTVRDLRERTGELIRDAEQGRVSVVTKHGRPAFVAVPFDKRMLELGVQRALAVRLFEEDVLGLSQAAKFAGLCIEDFLGVLSAAGVPAVDYPPEELDAEMEAVM
ncbi:MAG TPA: type II toxin-antitoxin system prevent-host-death family antitoxin [Planctomycetota bacterium]|nr:type II toxin-antitoxin system prevent-host-death family antitoxin [Planctomycetota bacterium]